MKYPSFKLLEHVLVYFNRLSSLRLGSRKISSIEGSERDRQNFYKDVRRLELILGRSILDKVPGHGTVITPEQIQLLEKIEEIVVRVKDLYGDGPGPKVRLRLATSHLLSLRVAAHLVEAFREQIEHAAGDGQKPDVEITLASPYELINSIYYKKDHDLILTVVPMNFRFDKPPLGDVIIHRCILVQRDHEFVRYKEQIEQGDFDFEMLKGQRVALVADAQRIPDFAKEEVEQHAKEVVVTNSTLECHAHVRVGNADLTFTHRDALSESDMRHLCCIDLTNVKEHKLSGIRLCLLSGGRRRTRADESQLLNQLTENLLTYFRAVETRYDESTYLLGLFRKFRYSHHSSFVAEPTILHPTRKWIFGELSWEVHVPPSTAGTRPICYHVGGTQRFHGPSGRSEPLPFFGRVVNLEPDQEGYSSVSGRSYLWRGSYFKDESGSFSVVFGHDDLKKSPYLFGIWTGTPAWVEDKRIQIAGCMIFHKSKNMEIDSLNRIVQEQRNGVRVLYGSKVNPQDPWQVPDDICGGPSA